MKPLVFALGAFFAAQVLAAGPSPGGEIAMPADARKLKLGLWEVTRRSEHLSPAIDAASIDTSGMDPAAKARVEAVLKKQAAERAARGGAPEVTTRTKQECLTQEALDKREKSFTSDDRHDMTCPPVVKTATASRLVVSGNCNVDGQKFTYELEFEVKSPEEMIMKRVSSGSFNGHPVGSNDIVTSKWIGAACGNAKPAR
jgi:hypothetical protein